MGCDIKNDSSQNRVCNYNYTWVVMKRRKPCTGQHKPFRPSVDVPNENEETPRGDGKKNIMLLF